MKPETLARLDLLAAGREEKLREEIAQQHAALARLHAQQEMLRAYQDRLGASWRNGAIVSAAQACRSGQFAAGASAAQAQLVETAARAQLQLETAITALARVKAQRRKLAERQHEDKRRREAAAAAKVMQDLPWRGAGGVKS
jgi:hypothetical protein